MHDLWRACVDFSEENGKYEFIEWDINVSLYNHCSGNTHLLNLFPYEILQFLLLKPASLAVVSKHMAILCDEENDEKWRKKILIILKQLEELELIEH